MNMKFRAGMRLETRLTLILILLGIYIGAISQVEGRAVTLIPHNSMPFPGLIPRAFDIRWPTLVLGIFRDVVTLYLLPYWLLSGDNCPD